MKVIKEYRVITNEDTKEFQKQFTESLEKFQQDGYELDVKYSVAVTKSGNLISSVMILCY